MCVCVCKNAAKTARLVPLLLSLFLPLAVGLGKRLLSRAMARGNEDDVNVAFR